MPSLHSNRGAKRAREARAALTDDGLPPLAASGLKLHDRLGQIAASLDRVQALAGFLPGGLAKLRQLLRRGLEETAALWPPVRAAMLGYNAVTSRPGAAYRGPS